MNEHIRESVVSYDDGAGVIGDPPKVEDFFADVVLDAGPTVDPLSGQTELAPGWTIPGAAADYRKYLRP